MLFTISIHSTSNIRNIVQVSCFFYFSFASECFRNSSLLSKCVCVLPALCSICLSYLLICCFLSNTLHCRYDFKFCFSFRFLSFAEVTSTQRYEKL